jgi:tRNA-Thr(GGU) m(6)t(6)A37 methyltransferase TsaA
MNPMLDPALNTKNRKQTAMHHSISLQPIGVIESPFRDPAGTPIQPSRARGAQGKVRVDPSFQAGLRDLEGFERIWLIYWFHRAPEFSLLVTPFLDSHERGVFATRAPARPFPVGISVVRLVSVHEGILEIDDVDIIDGTPLLDVKPYVPEFDCYPESRAGWFDESRSRRRLADGRFQVPPQGGSTPEPEPTP